METEISVVGIELEKMGFICSNGSFAAAEMNIGTYNNGLRKDEENKG
jgi:hypothetical protein